jgi:hypothetical protein
MVKTLKVKALKKLWKRFEAAMAAVAFAEEGEIEAARQIMSEARGDEAGERQRDEPHRPTIVAVPVAQPISAFLGAGVERQIGGGANAP